MASSPPRVFIDASVLFAASFSATGFARDLILAPTRGLLELFVSPYVLEETGRNLTAKAPLALPYFHAFQAASIAQVVSPDAALVRRVAHIVVVKDAPIIAVALEANAPYIASFDRKHQLRQSEVIRDHFGIIVDTPENILAAT